MIEGAASNAFSPSENWVSFQRNTCCKPQFSRWRKVHLVANRPIQLSWRNTYSLQKKTIVLEGGASNTFFPRETCVMFWKEYILQTNV